MEKLRIGMYLMLLFLAFGCSCLNSYSANNYKNIGWINLFKGDTDEAIENSTKAIQLNPADLDNYLLRGEAWSTKSNFTKAIEDYSYGLELSKNAILDKRKGEVNILLKSKPITLDDFNKKVARLYEFRGNAWLKQNKDDLAMKDFMLSLETKPNQPNLYIFMGGLYISVSKFDEALEMFTKAIQFDPKHPLVYYSRGFAWEQKGEPLNAIEDYSKAIELKPNDNHLYAIRGDAFSKIGNYGNAIQDLEYSIKLNSDDDFAHRALAWFLAGC